MYITFFRPARFPEPIIEKEQRVFAWAVDMQEIQRVEIRLPAEQRKQTFIKVSGKDTFPWYFDDPERSPVDRNRWGGGVPLILSGPGADRVITRDATEQKLAEYGLSHPQMVIILTLEDGDVLKINVGDKVPDGTNYYVQSPNSNHVSLVDYSWYDVLERLVTEPPYVPASAN